MTEFESNRPYRIWHCGTRVNGVSCGEILRGAFDRLADPSDPLSDAISNYVCGRGHRYVRRETSAEARADLWAEPNWMPVGALLEVVA